jgi:hypothetical protein
VRSESSDSGAVRVIWRVLGWIDSRRKPQSNLPGALELVIYEYRTFSDLGHRERAWAAFEADPEWRQAKSESEGDTGPLVVRVRAEIFAPTDYSPLQ